MNGEETTTIGQVAESQQNISNPTTTPSGSVEAQEAPTTTAQPQAEQPAVADNN